MSENIGLEDDTSALDEVRTTEAGAAVLEASAGADNVGSSFAPRPTVHRSTLEVEDWHGGVSSTFGWFCS